MQKSFNRDLILIGQHIKKLRKRKDYSQETFAEALEVSTMTVSRIENGATAMNILLLTKMAQVLEVTVQEILNINE